MVSAPPQTPEAAAIAFLVPKTTHSQTTVKVTAQSPHYAIVKFTNAIIESTPAAGYLLVRKFSFGWQSIDLTTNEKPFPLCAVKRHGVATGDLQALNNGWATTSPCTPGGKTDYRDAGAASDVDAIRIKMAGVNEIVPVVRVVGNYAFLEWWGWGGGENFYKRTPTGWAQFVGGGGALRPDELHQHYGVPLAIAKQLLKR